MNAGSQDIEEAFSAAYRDKFLQFLNRNSSPLTPSDRDAVCQAVDSSCTGRSPLPSPPPPHPVPPPPPPPWARMPWGVWARHPQAGTGGGRSLVRSTIIIALLVATAYVCYLIGKEICKTKKGLLSAALPQIDSALAWEGKPAIAESLDLVAGAGIPSQGAILVMFHADFCGHCQKAKAPYAKIAKTFPAAKLKMCDQKCHDALSQANKKEMKGSITAYPTFVAFRDGQEIDRKEGAPQGVEQMMTAFSALFS
jgi:thiol-disulfide isomerase/thioredoxin